LSCAQKSCIAAFYSYADLLTLSVCATRALAILLKQDREGSETQPFAVLLGLRPKHSLVGFQTQPLSTGVDRRFLEVTTHPEMVFALPAVPQTAQLANLVQLIFHG
jgi:hypothetical protein